MDFPLVVLCLDKNFAQLHLCCNENLGMLKTDAIPFFMSDSANLPQQIDVDGFGAAVHEIKPTDSTVAQYATLLLCS